MTGSSKGTRILNQFKAARIGRLRTEHKLSWRQIGRLVHMDYSGARKLWLRHVERERSHVS